MVASDSSLPIAGDGGAAPGPAHSILERVTGHALSGALPSMFVPPSPHAAETGRHARYVQLPQQPHAPAGLPPLFEPCAAADCQALHQRYQWLELRVSQLAARHMQTKLALLDRIADHERLTAALQASDARLHQLLAHQDRAKESERERIARDIHDHLGQVLMALRIDISALHARTTHSQPRLHAWTRAALANADAAIRTVKSLIGELRPFELELGLQAAVEWQIKLFRSRGDIDCTLDAEAGAFDAPLDTQRTLAMFRALQEALDNVARHAGASQVRVRFARDAGILSMTVSDNGVGLAGSAARANPAGSFGLLGIYERLVPLGGRLALDSAPGCGLALSVMLPVP